MKELTDKERSEIQEAEEARSVNLIVMYNQLRVDWYTFSVCIMVCL